MRTERVDEDFLLKYLLGTLPEEQQVQVEDRALSDAVYREALEAAEADLIDSYVRGELSPSDRRAFEQRFLASPQRRNKVEFARALARVSAEFSGAQALRPNRVFSWHILLSRIGTWNPALQLAGAMAVLLCVTGVSVLIVQNAGMRSRLSTLEAQRRESENREKALRQQLAEEQARAVQQPKQSPAERSGTTPLLASLVFVPGLARAERDVQELALNPSGQLARLEVQLESRDEFPRYRAELRTAAGDEVLIRGNLARYRSAAGFSVSLDVPATALAPGEYELALKGINGGQASDIGFYYFRVKRP